MRRTALGILAAVSLMLTSAVQGQECPWLSTGRIDRAFPDRAPWEVMAGGAGRCKFSSDSTRSVSFVSLTQMLQADAAAAADYVEKVGKGMAASYAVTAAPELGAKGVAVRQREAGGRMLTLIGHRGNAVVMAQLSFLGGVDEAAAAAAVTLAREVFTVDTGGGLELPGPRK